MLYTNKEVIAIGNRIANAIWVEVSAEIHQAVVDNEITKMNMLDINVIFATIISNILNKGSDLIANTFIEATETPNREVTLAEIRDIYKVCFLNTFAGAISNVPDPGTCQYIIDGMRDALDKVEEFNDNKKGG